MATAAEIRRSVYEHAFGASPTDRPFETLLAEALDNSETGIDVIDGDDWARGDIGEIVETGEQFYVLSVATNTLTVIRGYGSVSATAAADTGRVRKNPRFTQDQIDSSIKHCLNLMPSLGLHGFEVGTITLVPDQYYYELSETDLDQYGVLSVYYPDTNTERPVALPFTQYSNLSTAPTEWGASNGILLKSKGDRDDTGTVYFTYAQSLAYDTDLDTTLTKLLQEQEEIVVFGTVARLYGHTILPATQDPGARTDRTVQPGQTSRDGRWFQSEFFIKSRAEAARLSVLRKRTSADSVRTARARRWRS